MPKRQGSNKTLQPPPPKRARVHPHATSGDHQDSSMHTRPLVVVVAAAQQNKENHRAASKEEPEQVKRDFFSDLISTKKKFGRKQKV